MGALAAYQEAMKHTRGYDDNVVALADWMYMALRRLGRDEEAAAVLDRVHAEMDIFENHAYYRRCLMYKGLIEPEELLTVESASELDIATLGYGLGDWYLCNGDCEKAVAMFERVVSGPYWPVFGSIAAEAELSQHRK